RPPQSTLFPYTTLFRSQGNTPTIVTHADGFIFYCNINMFPKTHGMFINTVVYHLFKKDINSIIRAAAVSQFTDVHTGAKADMLLDRKSTRLNSSHLGIS